MMLLEVEDLSTARRLNLRNTAAAMSATETTTAMEMPAMAAGDSTPVGVSALLTFESALGPGGVAGVAVGVGLAADVSRQVVDEKLLDSEGVTEAHNQLAPRMRQ